MAERIRRRGYLDWMRGLAVLIMIETHLVDSWTGGPDRENRQFAWAMIVGGFGAPMFLFLTGAAVALSAGSKARGAGSMSAGTRAVARRGLQIFALAFLFRLQALTLGWGPLRTLVKVDILNILGLSIVAAAALWGATANVKGRSVIAAAACAAIVLVTPLVYQASALAALPDPIGASLRSVPGLTNFALFPWTGFVFAGVLLGIAIDRTRTAAEETRTNTVLGVLGVLIAVISYALSYLPSPFAGADFWTTSPAFFAIRVGIIATATALAFAWELRPGGAVKWSPLRQVGRTSLFIYWIHVEMVYGLISLPLHKALTLQQSLAALAAFTLFMLVCSLAKDRAVASWRTRQTRPMAVAFQRHS